MFTKKWGWVMATGVMVLALGSVGCQQEAVSPVQAGEVTLEQQDEELAAFTGAPMPLLKHLDCRLGLTDAQRREIRGILRRERRELRDAGVLGQGPEKVHAWVRGRRGRVADEIAGKLGPAQRETFVAMRERAEALTADGAGHGQVLAKLLDLDEAQQARVTALLDRQREALKELRQEARAGGITRAQQREKARTERLSFRAALKEILTPEQRARLEESSAKWRSECPQRAGGHRHGHGRGRRR